MAKSVLIEPVHDGSFKVEVKDSTAPGDWREVFIPNGYLALNNSAITLSENLVLLASDNVVRMVMRYAESKAIDRVYLEGLSKVAGLNINVYADDTVAPTLPTTLRATRVQDTQSARRRTANENLPFQEVAANTIMIEITGLDVALGPYPSNVLTGSSSDMTRGLNLGVIQAPTKMRFEIVWRVPFDSFSGLSPDVGVVALAIVNAITGESVLSVSLSGDSDQGNITYLADFEVSPSMNNPIPGAPLDSALELRVIDISGSSGSTPPYIVSAEITSYSEREVLSIEGVFIGHTAMRFADGHNWEVPHSDFDAWRSEQSGSQVFGADEYLPRSMQLEYSHETNVGVTTLRDLKHRLIDGFCLFDEDPDSLDPYTKILGAVTIEPWVNRNYNINSVRVTAQERKEWH